MKNWLWKKIPGFAEKEEDRGGGCLEARAAPEEVCNSARVGTPSWEGVSSTTGVKREARARGQREWSHGALQGGAGPAHPVTTRVVLVTSWLGELEFEADVCEQSLSDQHRSTIVAASVPLVSVNSVCRHREHLSHGVRGEQHTQRGYQGREEGGNTHRLEQARGAREEAGAGGNRRRAAGRGCCSGGGSRGTAAASCAQAVRAQVQLREGHCIPVPIFEDTPAAVPVSLLPQGGDLAQARSTQIRGE